MLNPDAVSKQERDQIAAILGCRMVDGVCVRHQSRPWEPRRPGCPFADAVMREGRETSRGTDVSRRSRAS